VAANTHGVTFQVESGRRSLPVARMPRRVTEVYTSNGRPCAYTERYDFANGQIQFDRPDVNCT
jgi:hypothetical protein